MSSKEKSYSQFGEDLIIKELIDTIPLNKTIVDIGARLLYSNSRLFIEEYGFTATLVESNSHDAAALERQFNKSAKVYNEKATIHNVNKYFDRYVDILSIDTDGNDWWLWAAIKASPKIVCIEFNKDRTESLYIAPYSEDRAKGNHVQTEYGATADAMILLGEMKGYQCMSRTVCNLIFMHKDYL